ncbi:MAG: hypothetical protein JSR41_18240 [Proteobacteria bacterium]|nr:hypothetical protein [Pseudomonadota bacterium]
MQPVLEIVERHAASFTYSVRAPRSGGVLPVSCYVDGGFGSLAECLADAAEAFSPYFSRVYVRFQGLCVGEHMVMRLRVQPEALAAHLVQAYQRKRLAADEQAAAEPARRVA